MTRAQNPEFSHSDMEDARSAYFGARLSDPDELFLDWVKRRKEDALRFSEPIDVLDVGAGNGEVTSLLLESLAESGVQLRSVTLVEPDPYALNMLDLQLLYLHARFPDTIFYVVQAKLEDFRPSSAMPTQFHLALASHVFPYLADPELCFNMLSGKLLRPNGRSIITAQMPAGMWAVVRELCDAADWHPYNDHAYLMNMDMLQEWASRFGVRSQLDVMQGAGIDVSPCFTGSRKGQLILSVLVGHVLVGGPPELLRMATEALGHHSQLRQEDPPKYILPTPSGVLILYGKDA